MMKPLEIVIICFLALWTVGAIVYIIRCRVKGKSTCGCCGNDCSHCKKKSKKRTPSEENGGRKK